MVYESEPRRSAQLTPAFLPPVPNTSIIERERQVHLWAKCLSQKLSQEAKSPGTKPSTSLKGTEKPFARTYISETKNCQVCMWQFGMWTSTSTRTRGSCVSLYKGTHLMCMSSCFGGRCFSPPPSEPVTLPSAQSTFQEPSRSHTHTLTRGVTRGSDGAKNNPSCRHKRAGEHTAVCCRKSVCVCVCVCVCVFVGAQRRWPRSPPFSSLTFQAGSSQIWLELEDASLFPSLACSPLWLSLFPRWASFLFISSWESCTHRSSLHPLPLALLNR